MIINKSWYGISTPLIFEALCEMEKNPAFAGFFSYLVGMKGLEPPTSSM